MNTKEQRRAYYEANKDKVLAKVKKYRESHKEEIAVKAKKYREEHKEEIAIKAKLYYEANKEEQLAKAEEYRDSRSDDQKAKHAAYMKGWYAKHMENPEYREKKIAYHKQYNAANRDKMNAFNAVYREKNKDKIRAAGKAYYERNKEAISFRLRERKYGLSKKDFEALIEEQEQLCAVCKKPLPENHSKIAIDHCHKTGKICGLLHTGCNVAVGAYENLGEQIEAYLKPCRED